MVKLKIRLLSLLALLLVLSSCDNEWNHPDVSADKTAVGFSLFLNPQTRAPQDLDLAVYSAKVYVFKESTANSDRFEYLKEEEITSCTFTITDLEAGTRHRFVFMALPKGQTPELPSLAAAAPAYTAEESKLAYINANQTGHEIFRKILTVTPQADSESTSKHSIVLTRQNGALQVRMSNASGELTSVKLEVEGMPEMYLHDGTGGKVITKGTPQQLSKEETPAAVKDYRITVNLLPAEDVTDKGKLTLTYAGGTVEVYDLTSTQGGIPIYPNQVTWLTLSGTGGDGGDGNFDVNFGPDINLDDDEWDGIHGNPGDNI